jgi:hypothetical protein
MSGNALSGSNQNQISVVVNTLSLSGNTTLREMVAGSDSSQDNVSPLYQLRAGNLWVYIDNSNGAFTADEQARIQNAINGLDILLAPYSVTITIVSDPTLANLVIDMNTTSASGGSANGVLGCYDAALNEITIIQGWNWYAGADPTQIGLGQYDFQSTVTHELGHALGLGHRADSNSTMYWSLATGMDHRTMTVADLNIPDPDAGASPDPLMAADFHAGDMTGARSTGLTHAANVDPAIKLGLEPGGVFGGPLLINPNQAPGMFSSQVVSGPNYQLAQVNQALSGNVLETSLRPGGIASADAIWGASSSNLSLPPMATGARDTAVGNREASGPVFFLGLQQSRSPKVVLGENEVASNQRQQIGTDSAIVRPGHSDLVAEANVPLLENSLVNLLALSLGTAAVPALISDKEREDGKTLQRRDRVIQEFLK